MTPIPFYKWSTHPNPGQTHPIPFYKWSNPVHATTLLFRVVFSASGFGSIVAGNREFQESSAGRLGSFCALNTRKDPLKCRHPDMLRPRPWQAYALGLLISEPQTPGSIQHHRLSCYYFAGNLGVASDAELALETYQH